MLNHHLAWVLLEGLEPSRMWVTLVGGSSKIMTPHTKVIAYYIKPNATCG